MFIFGWFPWNLIVYGLSNNLPSIQILSFIGTYSLNLLVITIFLLPSIIFFNYKKNIKIISLFLTFLIVFSNFIFGNIIIKKHEKIKETKLDFTIKVISPKININRFFANEDPEKIILDLINLSEPSKLKKTLFIFPEGVFSSIYLQDLKKYNYIFSNNYSNKHKIILGINSYEDSKIYNSLVVIDNNTKVLSKYDKNRLVPFGEFLPYENFFSKLGLKKITQGYLSFSASSKRGIIKMNNINFSDSQIP